MKRTKTKVSFLPPILGVIFAFIVFVLIARLAFAASRQPEFKLSPIPVVSGIFGRATLSPTCPGPRRSVQVCAAAFQGSFKVTNRDTNEVVKFSTDSQGNYKLKLVPGVYRITLDTNIKSKYPRLSIPVVEVKTNRLTEQPLLLDSGLR